MNIALGVTAEGVVRPLGMTSEGKLRISGGSSPGPGVLKLENSVIYGIDENGTPRALRVDNLGNAQSAGGSGSVSYPLLAPDGADGAPSYSFANDPAVGMYYDIAEDVVVLADAVQIRTGNLRMRDGNLEFEHTPAEITSVSTLDIIPGNDFNVQAPGDILLQAEQDIKIETQSGQTITFEVGLSLITMSNTTLDIDSPALGFFGTVGVAQAANIIDPVGGAFQDAESRAAIVALLDLLQGYGLMA